MDIIGMILRRSSTSSEQGQYDDNDDGGGRGGEGCGGDVGDNDVRGVEMEGEWGLCKG